LLVFAVVGIEIPAEKFIVFIAAGFGSALCQVCFLIGLFLESLVKRGCKDV